MQEEYLPESEKEDDDRMRMLGGALLILLVLVFGVSVAYILWYLL